MSHFAELDENNVVLRVVVGNPELSDEEGLIEIGNILGGTWVQTSYNGRIRYNFAGIGFIYDPIDDAFIAPMPECGHEELFLNDKKRWECSVCVELATAL